jgi:predicted secreted hydrolase
MVGVLGLHAGEWKLALPGWKYDFPGDHGNHPSFKTEWWYFTGNLEDAKGVEFGYQLTFFRQGIIPPGKHSDVTSRFLARDIQFAHFAVSEITRGPFHFAQRLSRGAFGEAGFGDGNRLAWIQSWECWLEGEHAFRLKAREGEVSIDLSMTSEKPPIFHGADGISRKAEGEGRASHYYSLTRLNTTGTVTTPAGSFEVKGWSWFDHEWATNQLAANQVGWDWFSLQFEDGSDLMMFQIRTKDGGRDPYSGGTYVSADGTTTAIDNSEFSLEPGELWKSPATGGTYPVTWKLTIPKLKMDLAISAARNNQELDLRPIAYWEGAIRVTGRRQGEAVKAKGYLEMTGYGSAVVGMQAAPDVSGKQ